MPTDINSIIPAVSFASLWDTLLRSLQWILAIIILFAFGYLTYHFLIKKSNQNKILKNLEWWEELPNRGLIRAGLIEIAEELTVQGTNLILFYVKSRDLFLPRFTRGVDNKTYFIGLTLNKEIINFNLKSFSEDLSQAELDYDHTDTKWAAENLREFVKRNYKDKSIPWWKEYKDLISTVVHIMINTFGFAVILYFVGGIVQDIGAVAGQMSQSIETLEQLCANPGSGIAPAK